MEAKDICVSFETAKALQDAGVVVESYFSWAKAWDWGSNISDWRIETMMDVVRYSMVYQIEYLPAPTAEELYSYLPKFTTIDDKFYRLRMYINNDNLLQVYYQYYPDREYLGDIIATHLRPCEAFAKLVIRVKEAGYELQRKS